VELGHSVVAYDPEDYPLTAKIVAAASAAEAVAAADAAVIASPSASHADHAASVLAAGRPVLVEKPLATSVAEGHRLVELAHRRGAVAGVAMNLRFHPGVLLLKELLKEGRLGRPLLGKAWFGYDLRQWRPGSDYRRSYSARADLGGGILLDAVHELDYLTWLLGPVAELSARMEHVSNLETDVEDLVLAMLKFETGALGSVDLNFFEPAYRRGCLIAGADAAASWDWNLGTVTVRRAGLSDETIAVPGDVEATYRAELVDFLDAVEEDREPRASLEAGVAVLRVVEAIRESSAQRRTSMVG